MEKNENYYIEARNLAYEKKFFLALFSIESAINLFPNNSEYLIEKAEILCELNRFQEALEFLYENAKNCDKIEKIDSEILKIRNEINYNKIALLNPFEYTKINSLLKWSSEYGFDASKIKIVYYSNNFRGVHANCRIKKGEIIAEMPNDLLITCDKICEESKLSKSVIEKYENELISPFLAAVAIMIWEIKQKKNTKSKWYEYVENYPTDCNNFPYFYDKEEFEYLKGTEIGDTVLFDIKQLNDEYTKLCNLIPEIKEMTFKNYLFYTTLANSRYFQADGAPYNSLSAPIIDMFNYYMDKADQLLWTYDNIQKKLIIKAARDIYRGEILSINYGNKSDGQFLLQYGFIPENNLLKYIHVGASLSLADPLLAKKQEIIGLEKSQILLYWHDFVLDYKIWFRDNEKAMSPFRFAAFEGEIKDLEKYIDMKKYKKNEMYRKLRISPISIENEKNALKLLSEFCQKRLSEFPNKLSRDEEILQNLTNQNSKNALQIRICEQKILMEIIEFTNKVGDLLSKSLFDAQIIIKKMPDKLWYKEYANHVSLILL